MLQSQPDRASEDDLGFLMAKALEFAEILQHRLETKITYDDDTLVAHHESMETSRWASDLIRFISSSTNAFQHDGHGVTDLNDLLSKEEVSREAWLDIGELAAVALELFQTAQKRLATVAMDLSICARTARKVAGLEKRFSADIEAAITAAEKKRVEDESMREFNTIMVSWCRSDLSSDGMAYLAERWGLVEEGAEFDLWAVYIKLMMEIEEPDGKNLQRK